MTPESAFQQEVNKRAIIYGCPYCKAILAIPSLKEGDNRLLCLRCLKIYDRASPDTPEKRETAK